MGSNFWDNKANEYGNRGQSGNNPPPPPNRPPNTPPPNSENPWDAYDNPGGNNNGGGNRNPWDNNNGNNNNNGAGNTQTAPSGALAQTYMSQVFAFMFGALMITAITAMIVGSSESMNMALHSGIMHWVIMFSPLIMLFVMMGRFHKMSASTMLLCFVGFAVLMGLSMGWIFMAYTLGSIFSTFLITAVTFGVMAVLGYTTSIDLTKFGSILMMAVIGIIIAMVVNWFMQSTMLHYIIGIVGVLVFTGLTAYDVQKLKRIGMGIQFGGGEAQKLAMMGAITLYLDFINLFMFLLRFLGNRN